MQTEAMAPVADGASARSRSPAWAFAVGTVGLTVAIYSQTWRDLWPLWMDTRKTTYTHGALVALVVLWLLWRKRQTLRFVPLRPFPWAVPAVLLASLAWMVLAKAGIFTLYTALWPILAWLGVLAACGWRVARPMAFPLGYLWFALPLWDHLNRVLQTGTVWAVDLLNRITHVPAVVDGDMVTIPSGQFEIAAGCSGLHYFMVALAIAALAGELHHDRARTRLMLLVLAGALALVSNWLRVYLIILAGHLTQMQHYLVKVDHYKFGWIVFAVAMIGFFLVVSRLPPGQPREIAGTPPQTGLASYWGVGTALVALVLWPVASWAATTLRTAPSQGAFVAPVIEGFTGPVSPSPAWRTRYTGPESELRVAYLTPGGRVVDYYANRYLEQTQDSELIGYSNRLVDGPALREHRRADLAVAGPSGAVPMRRVDASSASGEDWVILYRYYVGDRFLTGDLHTQITAGFRSLWAPEPIGIHAAAAPCRGDCAAAIQDAAALLTEVGGAR